MSARKRVGQWQAGLMPLHTLAESGSVPITATCSTVVSACKKGDPWQATRGLLYIVADPHLEPEPCVATCSAAVSAFEKGSR
eukprot:7152190-Alexandrium_andersonii.AAC.2